MPYQGETEEWRSWPHLRWLLMLPALAVGWLVGVSVLYVSDYFLQFPYFDWLDVTHRYATRRGNLLVGLGLGGLAGLLAMSGIVGLVAAIISPGFRKRARTIVESTILVVILWCLAVAIGIFAESKPTKKLPVLDAEWTANPGPTGTGITDRHFTQKMVFPDGNHLVIETGGQLTDLDTKSGRVLATRAVGGRDPLVFASPSGKVVVSSGNQLELLSAQLEPTGVSLSLTGGFAGIASPSGARIAWQHYKGPPKVTFVDTDSLKPAETFAACNAEGMTDHSVVESVVLVNEKSTPALNVCEPGSAQHVLYRGTVGIPGSFVYLNNEFMLMIGNRLTLLDAAGKVRAFDSWPDQHVDFAGASRDGSRFAIAIERWGWGDPAAINKVTIIVYDTESFRPIAEVDSRWVAAFSPDGKALAASSGFSTSYFRLPK